MRQDLPGKKLTGLWDESDPVLYGTAGKFKYNTTLRIGRVKTPTLALVVNRELEIKNFVKHSYYDLKAFWTKTV